MTLLEMRGTDDLLSVRFACSPIWETEHALRTLADDRARSYHEPWHRLVEGRMARLDLASLLVVQPTRGYVPDFLTPPPRTPHPRLRDQLAEIRATSPEQVAHELELCRDSVQDQDRRRLLDAFLEDPARTRDLLASRLHEAWVEIVAPYWIRIRTLLDRDIDERSRTLARHGFRHVLDGLHPRIHWTRRGLLVADGDTTTVRVDERGLVLMPSAYVWPYVDVVVEGPWLPTIAYPARGIADLWRAPTAPPDGLARLLGRTRALVLASLDRPLSTTALAALLELSPAGVSRHLLALRDAGLVTSGRHGHEVRYRRAALGSALLRVGT